MKSEKFPKVLFITSWGDNPNTRVVHILNYLNSQNIESLLIGRKNKRIPHSSNIKFFDIPFNKNHDFLKSSFASSLVRFIVILRSIKWMYFFRPHYVYVRELYLSVIFIILSKVFNFKIIHESHGMSHKELNFKGKFTKSSFVYSLDKFVFTNSELVVAITEQLKKNLSLFRSENKTIVIGNGVSKQRLLRMNNLAISPSKLKINKSLIGFIGNWEQWIDIETLLKSSNYLPNNYKIVIIGEGPKLNFYKSFYPNICFLGRLPNEISLHLLSQTDICISPWSSETLFEEKSARKTIEYMSLGKPIIVSNVIGKENFLVENKNCIFYNPQDPRDLSQKILALSKNKKLREKLSLNNLDFSKNFQWSLMIDKSKLYSKIMS